MSDELRNSHQYWFDKAVELAATIVRLEAERDGAQAEYRHHIQLNAGLRLENGDMQGHANVLRAENKRLEAKLLAADDFKKELVEEIKTTSAAYHALCKSNNKKLIQIQDLEAEIARLRELLDTCGVFLKWSENAPHGTETVLAQIKAGLAEAQPASTEGEG